MTDRVDVWLARDSLASLRPPPASIVDGRAVTAVVSVCCLHRRAGVSRFAVSLRVDEATAYRFARACRLERMWQRRVVPSVLALAALAVVPAIVGAVNSDMPLLLLTNLVLLCIATVTIIGRVTLNLQRSRHHPVVRRGRVLIRDADRATAAAWASLNPAGTVDLPG
jgi:hypothetical protein